MAFSTSTVSIGATTKKSDYDRLMDNTKYLKSETAIFTGTKTFNSATVFNSTATFNGTVGNLKLHGTVNADRKIEYASDADVLWDESEDEFYLNKSLKVDDGIETDGSKLKTKIVEIGDWNMSSTITLNVNHGIIDYRKIRSVTFVIRNDSDNEYYAGNTLVGGTSAPAAGAYIISSTYVRLTRVTSGFFDSADFNATSYNRGWITVIHGV